MDTTQEEKRVDEEITTPTEIHSEEIVASPVQSTPLYKNKQLLIAVCVAVILLLGAGSYVYTTQDRNGTAVAVVNGKKIYQKEYTESLTLIKQTATQQGEDVTQDAVQEAVKKQALEVLVNSALLVTAAEKKGITADNDEVQVKYDELVTQLGSQEELTKKMAEVNLTETKLRSNIRERIITDKYIELETNINDITVSDTEIAEFVKQISTGDTELPPLEEIRPQIEAQILNQKQQQIIQDLLEKLKSEAEIQILI